MSFPLINPSHQFFDSSGSPLVSGTLEFRDPTSNDLIKSYPTADDADAQTNENANPLTLDSRGGFTGLYLEDGVKYKIILKDSSGSTVDTQDDVRCPQFTALETDRTITIAQAELGISIKPVAREVTVASYTTGAHAALRDFTGTTTAAQALQLLETLVDDLAIKGILP